MNAMNAGTSVQKEMGPEEHAILENIGALIQELETGSNAAPEDESQEARMQPGAAKAENPVMQPVTKAEEQFIAQMVGSGASFGDGQGLAFG